MIGEAAVNRLHPLRRLPRSRFYANRSSQRSAGTDIFRRDRGNAPLSLRLSEFKRDGLRVWTIWRRDMGVVRHRRCLSRGDLPTYRAA